jgi:hypothetical protein
MIQALHRDTVITSLSALFQTEAKSSGNTVRFEIKDSETQRKLALEIHFDIDVEDGVTTMVSVYSQSAFLQLHNCTGFITSDLLEQVTFFGKQNGLTTGLIVEKQAGCSLYANVNDAILKGDFTKLPPELMMCSVALSLTDTIDFEGFTFDE